MSKSDWYGLGTSVALHALLILLLALMNVGAAEPEPLGYIEVEFGPIAEGRPVQRAVETQPEAPEAPEPEPEAPPEPEAAPPQEAKPVDLAKQRTEVRDAERVQAPETETISPATQNEPAEVIEPEPRPEPRPAVKPLGGATDGDTGESTGRQGEAADEQKSAPFQIEGLNRSTVYAPLPAFAEKVNAQIKMRITVDPQGRITAMQPVLKGNPSLERAVREALNRWRFNALPPNAPQQSQVGVVTFRFVVE
ncbi:MAG: energy transducer TonB [Rhodothermales bacterium]|nr:energy transducer TonB [Rhodothermales bacterium]